MKLNIHLPYDPANTRQDLSQEMKLRSHKFCAQVFTEALPVIAKMWN